MPIETPPSEKPYDKPEGERRGSVNTGDGKGKSTAVFGLALRACGSDKAVKISRFMKVPTASFSEHHTLLSLRSFDFAFLMERPWLRGGLIVLLSLQGTALRLTSCVMAWRVLMPAPKVRS